MFPGSLRLAAGVGTGSPARARGTDRAADACARHSCVRGLVERRANLTFQGELDHSPGAYPGARSAAAASTKRGSEAGGSDVRSKAFHSSLAVVMLAGGLGTIASAQVQSGDATVNNDAYKNLPNQVVLNGVVRDFAEKSVTGGHPDFELSPTAGFGHYMGEAKDTLDSEGKPQYNSSGYKVSTQWSDASGRNRISPREYIAGRTGDKNGAKSTSLGGAMTSAERFSQWYRDVPGVNVSKQLAITLQRQSGSNMYTFNDKTDTVFKNLGGFFPINGDLFGNSKNDSKNFHFTFELNTEFIFRKNAGQVFTFTGDDDVWVFIDGKLVIDIGGIHSAVSQSIELDRLNWLEDGKSYSLRFFFAERHRTQSNCRIDTNLELKSIDPPATTALFD